MENIFPQSLMDLLTISISLSFIVMCLIQKFKTLSIITKSYQIWILNLIFSFLIGVPFGNFFYNLGIYEGLWISLFTFIGAPTLYETFKNQTIINYTPRPLDSTISVPTENEIKTENKKI